MILKFNIQQIRIRVQMLGYLLRGTYSSFKSLSTNTLLQVSNPKSRERERMHPTSAISLCSSTHFFSIKGHMRKEEMQCAHQHKRSSSFGHTLASPLMAAILTLSSPILITPPASYGETISYGATLFQKACIGCHDMGGNILQPGATLFMNDLQRNGVATEEGIYNITYYGKGRMPGFGEKCTPRGQCTFGPRLQEDEIKLLSEFVKSQADRGWPNVETYGD